MTQTSPTFVPARAGGNSSPVDGNGQGSAQAAAMAAMAGAASSARGIAAKVGSSFSGITRNRTRPEPGGPTSSRPGYPTSPGGAPLGAQNQTRQRPSQASRPTGAPQPRRALLSLERIEPLSVMKFSFLISLVAWIIVFIAVAVIYFTLSKLGVFAKIEHTVGLITSSKTQAGSNAAAWFSASRVFTYTALVCTINAILFTALATIGAALYNLVSHLTGGIEVTLKESD